MNDRIIFTSATLYDGRKGRRQGTTVVVEKDKQEPAPSWFDRVASPDHPLLADAA